MIPPDRRDANRQQGPAVDRIVVGQYTVQDLLVIAGVAVVALALVAILRKILSGSKTAAHTQRVRCDRCGWQGTVSRYAGRCPGCNHPLGERKAGRDGG